MSFIKEISDSSNLTRYYYLENVNTNVEAISWLSSIREIDGFFTYYFSYKDLVNRSDEGSESIQINSQESLKKMKLELQNRKIDKITIVGDFFNKTMVIGVDLHTFEIHITIDKNDPADIQQMERLLNLI